MENKYNKENYPIVGLLKEIERLKFGIGNRKLEKNTLTFALPAGHFCPFAKNCLSKANKKTGKIKDGKHTQYRCFGASLEAVYKETRQKVWHNADLLRRVGVTKTYNMSKLIVESIKPLINNKIKYVRIHETGGDFFNDFYLQAWILAIKQLPEITFYAYTKACKLVYLSELPEIASITYSKGGTQDSWIDNYNLKQSIVVNYESEAKKLGLEIDIDDSLARNREYKRNFALLIHGTQPKGTIEAKANYYNMKNKVKDRLKAEKKS